MENIEKELIEKINIKIKEKIGYLENKKKWLEAYKKVMELTDEEIILEHIETGNKNLEIDSEVIIPLDTELLIRILKKLDKK